MLGAGFVTRPTLDILCQSGISVTVGVFMPQPRRHLLLLLLLSLFLTRLTH